MRKYFAVSDRRRRHDDAAESNTSGKTFHGDRVRRSVSGRFMDFLGRHGRPGIRNFIILPSSRYMYILRIQGVSNGNVSVDINFSTVKFKRVSH